ncbi:amino acid adenylation domain-containing protein [Micromonospora sp. NBC_00617]|uniref:amino acid adenylation domain-containing protein n=1 Tax=Micromonospora sp. NBC_00617 TaxID=2903587 RepID=UPI0030E46D84
MRNDLNEGLHQRVARLARLRPDAVALVAEERPVTYDELDRTADGWAARLAGAGVGPGSCVPVVLPRGTDQVTALLAVLKTGAAYAMLDPAWPAARLGEVTAMLPAPVLIADRPVPGVRRPVWTPPEEPLSLPPDFRPAEVGGHAPCCVFFTSGTTGRPKGVLTPHRATARLFMEGTFATFGEHTVVPLAAPSPWDAYSLELWAALLNGGTSVIVAEPYLTAGALREGVSRHGVTTVWLTSSLFDMVVDEDLGAFDGLRQLMIGGERLSPTHVGRFLRQHPDVLLLNGYGPVESTVFTTTHRIRPEDARRAGGVPLGRPVPGTEVLVLDGDRPCAPGAVGEICVAGAGLALRYLGDDELTAQKFVNVTADGRTVRVYRTGDLGLRDADGLLHFRGRADRQVKIRGHRIEPAEIERRVEELLPVRSCRVVADRTGGGEPALVAWCIPERPGDPLDGAIGTLREVLPAYQVPTAVHTVGAFPVTPQGKLDERALLATLDPRPMRAVGVTTAADGGEALVAEVFAEVLGQDSAPVDVPFTELGASSLDLGRACARLAARLDRPVPLVRLLEHPSARALAAWLRADQPAPDTPDGDAVPLTPMQLVYLTRHLVDPADRTGHCLLTWVIEGDLDHAALETAVGAVHARHEPLRAAYVADPRPMAEVLDIDPPPLEVLPAAPSVEEAMAALRRLFADELVIGEADVWRVAVAGAGDATVFGCVIHHIAFDGWSEAVLARDLATAYNAARCGAEPPAKPAPPSLAHSYRDHIARVAASGTDVRPDRAGYAGPPPVRWPGSPADGAGTNGPGLVPTRIEPAVLAAVDDAARSAGVSRFAVLLYHFGAALAEVTGQRDLAVGVPVAQRHGAGSELAVGCHLTMLCLRLRGAALADGPAALRATGQCFGDAFAAQDGPASELAYQVLFALQDNAPAELRLDGARTMFVRQRYLDLPLDLHVELWPEDDGLRLTAYHRPERVAEETARDLVKRLDERLRA